MKGVIGVAVVSWLWIGDGSSISISESISLIEVWAVLHSMCSSISSNHFQVFTIRSLNPCLFLLCNCVIWVAIVMWLWVCDSSGITIGESHSFIEVRAMLESSNISTNSWNVLSIEWTNPFQLGKSHTVLVVSAVVMWFWVWNGRGCSILKSISWVWCIWAVL